LGSHASGLLSNGDGFDRLIEGFLSVELARLNLTRGEQRPEQNRHSL